MGFFSIKAQEMPEMLTVVCDRVSRKNAVKSYQHCAGLLDCNVSIKIRIAVE